MISLPFTHFYARFVHEVYDVEILDRSRFLLWRLNDPDLSEFLEFAPRPRLKSTSLIYCALLTHESLNTQVRSVSHSRRYAGHLSSDKAGFMQWLIVNKVAQSRSSAASAT